MIGDIARATRRGLAHVRAELAAARALRSRSTRTRVQDVPVPLSRAYYFTSEKGVFRLESSGIYRVLDVACYGIAIGGPWVFLALYSHDTAIMVRGDRRALHEPGRDFAFREIYRLRTLSSNERIHGLYLGDEALWVANTGRNTLLQIDPEAAEVVAEIPVIRDRFDRPVLFNNNHINSVSEYDGTVLFAAYRAGAQSMIGVYDGATVTGFGYPCEGVHDIFLTEGGFVLCDTFGANTDEAGGMPVTEEGPLDPRFFARPPGCIVRGVAGSPDELLIGHSHKGERAQRFEGRGAILIARDGRVVGRIDVRPAQVYQIITEDGDFTVPRPRKVEADALRRMFRDALGPPIYEAALPAADAAVGGEPGVARPPARVVSA